MDIPPLLRDDIRGFVLEGIDETIILSRTDPFWQNLKKTGTEIWLDTGDMEKAGQIWSAEMTALTTNNTLLNNEIQKGFYDEYISRVKMLVSKLPLKQQILEVAFILNARHGLRLAKKFSCKVSVELHTDTAHDYKAIVDYGLRLFEICPEHFLIKVPFTATGLIAARYLQDRGVRVNLTLDFSARQNAFATLIVRPDYVNVFLGRLGAYVRDNDLGSPLGIGERTTMVTQKLIKKLAQENPDRTRLISASIRDAQQLENLAGVDTMTIPVQVAMEGRQNLKGVFTSKLDHEFSVTIKDKEIMPFMEKLWEVTEPELLLAHHLSRYPPKSGIELIHLAHEAGCVDMFPILSSDDLDKIASDGKIPNHRRWMKSIRKGQLAIDTLLNLAGLASFANDQASLDKRVARILLQ